MKDIQFNLFSVPIWGLYIRHDYQCRDYVDFLLKEEQNKPSVQKSNLGGYQTADTLHQAPIFKELVNEINRVANGIIAHIIKPDYPQVGINGMWGNINYKGASNGSHVHTGLLSGVFYCQVPENSGRLVLINPAVRSDASPIREHNHFIVPKKCACIIFPSWLEHYVEPSQSDERRISISFNIERI